MAYTTATAVAAFIGAPDFSAGTNPSLTDVTEMISDNDSLIDRRTWQAWESKSINNEVHDLREVDQADRNLPDPHVGQVIDNVHRQMTSRELSGSKVYVHKQPLLTVTKVEERSSALGATETWRTLTVDSDYKVYADPNNLVDGSGYILLLGARLVSAHRAIRVTYTYGLATTPGYIKRLSRILTAIDVLRAEQRANNRMHLAEVELDQARYKYAPGALQAHINQLQKEADEIWDRVIGQRVKLV